jgi:hypothetical protein
VDERVFYGKAWPASGTDQIRRASFFHSALPTLLVSDLLLRKPDSYSYSCCLPWSSLGLPYLLSFTLRFQSPSCPSSREVSLVDRQDPSKMASGGNMHNLTTLIKRYVCCCLVLSV